MMFDQNLYQPPFPYFGGKSRAASLIWERLGDVPNYVEPFFGSGAALFLRPHWPFDHRIETINDKNGYIANFWRAMRHDPAQVARWADWPANENDLHARHYWLKQQAIDLDRKLEGDPNYYDAKIAGWWVWGMCLWIGHGFCDLETNGPWSVVDGKLLHLGDNGRGINRQLLHLGDNGNQLLAYFEAISERLRRVRVCSGDWTRVIGPTPTEKLGLTGILLDPPYNTDAGRDNKLYATEDTNISNAVRKWAIENGNNPLLRIALCGYDTEHGEHMPDDWEMVEWKAQGGYSNQNNDNPTRERIWFSPHCLLPVRVRQLELI